MLNSKPADQGPAGSTIAKGNSFGSNMKPTSKSILLLRVMGTLGGLAAFVPHQKSFAGIRFEPALYAPRLIISCAPGRIIGRLSASSPQLL